MKRFACAIALCFGLMIIGTGCGSSGGSSSTSSGPSCSSGQVIYNINGNNTCVTACGNNVSQGVVNGVCTTVNSNTGAVGTYGSCITCTMPNGNTNGVWLMFNNNPSPQFTQCGIPLGNNMGQIGGAILQCSPVAGSGTYPGYGGGYTPGYGGAYTYSISYPPPPPPPPPPPGYWWGRGR